LSTQTAEESEVVY